MFSDLNFYKIVKVKRKVNENVMIRILQFFIPTKNLIKMFKAPTLPLAKRSPRYTLLLLRSIYYCIGITRPFAKKSQSKNCLQKVGPSSIFFLFCFWKSNTIISTCFVVLISTFSGGLLFILVHWKLLFKRKKFSLTITKAHTKTDISF